METKENTSIVTGDLCYYNKIPVLVLQRVLNEFNFTDNCREHYWVLFPQGGIDTVSLNSLKLIL